MHRLALSALLLVVGCGGEVPGPSASRARSPEPPPAAEPAAAPDEAAPSEASAGAAAEPEPPPEPDVAALDPSTSTSIGGARDGSLRGAASLPESGPGFRSNPARPNPTAHFGTVEMVRALVRAARTVHEELPGGELTINDIGFAEGGPIAHHGSHRAGRDVDVLFYLLDRRRQPMPSIGAFLDPAGRGYDFRELADPRDDVVVRLDAPRTWRFVRALLEDEEAGVQRIFVAEHLRALLLREAERSRAPAAVRARFEEVTCQPGYPHDDHLHIRLHCSVEDMAAGCADSPPVYGWRRAALRALGLAPVLERPRPDRPRAPTLTHDEARARAGRMHARVTEWLVRREAWLRAPHPGRTYCR